MSTASFSRFSSSSTSANLWTPQRATGRLFRSLFVRANSQHANFSSTFLPISKCDFSSHTMSSKVLFVWLNYALCWGLSWLKTAAIHQTVGLMLTWTIWRITDSQHTTSCYIPCLQQVTVKTAYFEHGLAICIFACITENVCISDEQIWVYSPLLKRGGLESVHFLDLHHVWGLVSAEPRLQ